MATINSSDIIFATVIQRGRTIASVRLSGMHTVNDIIRYLSGIVKNTVGMITLSLRNGTQGWQQERNVMFGSLRRAEGVQLSLF